jgi:hypothetical protein
LTRPPRIVAVAAALALVVLLAAPATADPDPPAGAAARAAALRALLLRHPVPAQPADPLRRWLGAVLDALNGYPERIEAAIADALTSQIAQAEAEAAGEVRRQRAEGMTDKALARTLVTLARAAERTGDEATRRHLVVEAAQLQVVLARRRLIGARAAYQAAQDEFVRTGSGLAQREAAAKVLDEVSAALAERETALTGAIAARDGVRLRPASSVSAAIPVTMPAEVAALGLATAHRQALSEQEEHLRAVGAELLAARERLAATPRLRPRARRDARGRLRRAETGDVEARARADRQRIVATLLERLETEARTGQPSPDRPADDDEVEAEVATLRQVLPQVSGPAQAELELWRALLELVRAQRREASMLRELATQPPMAPMELERREADPADLQRGAAAQLVENARLRLDTAARRAAQVRAGLGAVPPVEVPPPPRDDDDQPPPAPPAALLPEAPDDPGKPAAFIAPSWPGVPWITLQPGRN